MTKDEEMKNKDNNNKEYEKDLNDLKEQILKEGNTLVSKRNLLERFCEIDKEYNGNPWNLLQILSNINILIGEESSEDCVSRQVVADFLGNHAKDYEDTKIRMAFMAASSLVKNADNVPSATPTRKKGKWIEVDTNMYTCSNCSHCFTIVPEDNQIQEFKCCPNCKTEMEGEE